jgi:fucose 4-O-acetylase-like acetyltransferase
MSGKEHYTEIDIARGIGILFVVLGHAVKQTQVSAVWIRIVTYIVYSFHMPLFFLLSGFVAVRILRMQTFGERLRYIGNRAVRLLVPYFVIGALYIPVKLKLSAYAVTPFTAADIPKMLIGQNPDVSLWFLYILFVITAIAALFVNEDNFRSILYGSFALSAASYWANISYRTPKYFFFFLLGFWVRLKFEDSEKEGNPDVMQGQGLMAAVVLVFDVFCIAFLYRTTIMVTMVLTTLSGIYLVLWFSTRLVYGRAAGNSASDAVKTAGSSGPDAAGAAGSSASDAVKTAGSSGPAAVTPEGDTAGRRPGKAALLLQGLGLMSMDIYILHEPVVTVLKLVFWNRLGWNYILCTALFFILGVLIPIPVSRWLIRPVPLFRFLLFGELKGLKKSRAA